MISCKRKKANFYLSPKKAFIRKKEKNSFQKFSKIQNNDNLFFYFFLLLGFTNLVSKSFWKPIYRTTVLDSSFSIPNRTKTSKWFAVNLKYYRHPVREDSTVHIAIKRNWLNINLPPSTPLYTRVTVKQRQASLSAIQCTGASSQSKPNPTHHQVGWGGGGVLLHRVLPIVFYNPPGAIVPHLRGSI